MHESEQDRWGQVVGLRVARLMVMTALIALPLSFASATPTPQVDTKRAAAAKPAKKKVSADYAAAASLRPGALGSFTPSIIDPARSPALSRGLAVERSFRFTPSGRASDSKSVTLGLTTRVLPRVDLARGALASATTPAGYNVDLSVGYQGFALTGGYSRLGTYSGTQREGIDLGLSYRGRSWKASLQASGENPKGYAFDPLSLDRRYGVELGGAYAVTPRLSVNGGMRYQMITPLDPTLRATDERGTPAVYLGTAFSF